MITEEEHPILMQVFTCKNWRPIAGEDLASFLPIANQTTRALRGYNVRLTPGEHRMRYRKFGRTGWNVSEIGYGMWGMAGWTGSEDKESLASLQRAVDLGCNFFDTAWAYGNGHSEELLGKVLRANKNSAKSGGPDKKLYVATKIPPKNRRWPARPEYSLDESYPPDYIFEYMDKSLANLGLETLDLIQFHTWEDVWLDEERLPRAIEKLRASGKVRAVGISQNRWEPANGIRAVRAGIVDAVQVIYNIFDQNPEDELFPACSEKNVAVIARVPFDEGSLTGTLTLESHWPKDDWRSTYFVPENLEASVTRADALKPLVPAGMTLPEMALRFILNNSDVHTIIPGMRKRKNVESNLAASDKGPLPATLHQKLRPHRWDRTPTKWSQ
jgi:aryl-alcohol dehydrogenase-like predicted oxidoreductase